MGAISMNANFDPPYDSPIEEALAWSLSKRLETGVLLHKQVEVPTPFGGFRLDFVVESPCGRRIGLECDGKDYHTNPVRDECRDAMILSLKTVKAIYRFQGKDLHYRTDDCVFYIQQKDGEFFSERGRTNLDVLASKHIRRALACPNEGDDSGGFGNDLGDHVTIFYEDEKEEESYGMTWMYRRTLEGHARSGFMKEFLQFASSQPRTSFDAHVRNFEAMRRKAYEQRKVRG